MLIKKLGIALVLLLAIPTIASAWGKDGHQQVGKIADQLLADGAPVAKAHIEQLLGTLPSDKRNLETIAVWADCAKGATTFDGQKFTYSPGYPECKSFETDEEIKRIERFAWLNWVQCGPPHGSEYCHHQYHYVDVATSRAGYREDIVGTSEHDIVHAINAAIAVLRDESPDCPFNIYDKREALMLLTHYLGDIHQPLHVRAMYLDAKGHTVDPDKNGYTIGMDTAGGNNLSVGSVSLHHLWDELPAEVYGTKDKPFDFVGAAKSVPDTDPAVEITGWSALWATDTIVQGKDVFTGLTFTLQGNSKKFDSTKHKWDVVGYDEKNPAYLKLKQEQLARGGARLAQLLKVIWPNNPPSVAGPAVLSPRTIDPKDVGYLSPNEAPDVRKWMPPFPKAGCIAYKADVEKFESTRKFIVDKAPRRDQAAWDDVYDPPAVVERFKDALGKVLTRANAPTLMALIDKVEKDGSVMLAPVKLKPADGGRKRPYATFVEEPSCLSPIDIAGKRSDDEDNHHLKATGSYPSGHALIGMVVGMILSEVAPDRSDAIFARGIEFGNSRLVCGFHYPSDLTAGRLVASALFARLQSNSKFVDDLKAARKEYEAASP